MGTCLSRRHQKLWLVILMIALFTGLLGTSCAPVQSFDRSLKDIARPYVFSLAGWEFNVFKSVLSNQSKPEAGTADVLEYFDTVERIRSLEYDMEQFTSAKSADSPSTLATLEDELKTLKQRSTALTITVETILEKQVMETLQEYGIFHPLDKYLNLSFSFPPINFKLDNPPHLLVISPRDRIESLREILLRQGLGTEDMESIESEADGLDVSSLVVELGGFATYPSFVTNRGGLLFTITTAVEEWLHQYLAFKPLGFRYLLDLSGINPDYEIATMNETVASMVSDEIGNIVYQKYYAQNSGASMPAAPVSGFDFNREMRETRKTVDTYLAQGEIEQAEQYMNERRQYLEDNGYYIRKLNQAYFAFHGAYADDPTSIDPIGTDMKELRARSSSLKEFLDTAAALTSHQDLTRSLQ